MTWAFIPCTCSVAQAGDSSPTNYSDIALLAQSKSKSIPEKFCSHGSLTEAYLDSLFGITCARSEQTTQQRQTTSSDFAELLATWPSAVGFPAKTSAQQEKAKVSRAKNPGSGPNSLASFARFDRDTCSWKIPQCSLLGASEPFSETWPQWGMWDAGACWELPTLVPRISENGSGFWPTPSTTGLGGGSNSRNAAKNRGMWPTPTKSDGTGGPGNSVRDGGDNLRTAVRFATPKASDGERGGRGDLLMPVRGVPSPSGRYKLPTPTAQDAKHNGSQSQQARNSKPINAEVGGSLSPDWVEWLMGWPIGFTALEPLKHTEPHPWDNEPDIPRISKGVKNRANRLQAIGNGQVPQCAAAAWMILETEPA